jgi:hypothetical protein
MLEKARSPVRNIQFDALFAARGVSTLSVETVGRAKTWPLNRALQKVRVFRFLTRARGGPGARGRPPRALRGPSRGLRGPPGGLQDLRQTKAKNLET